MCFLLDCVWVVIMMSRLLDGLLVLMYRIFLFGFICMYCVVVFGVWEMFMMLISVFVVVFSIVMLVL